MKSGVTVSLTESISIEPNPGDVKMEFKGGSETKFSSDICVCMGAEDSKLTVDSIKSTAMDVILVDKMDESVSRGISVNTLSSSEVGVGFKNSDVTVGSIVSMILSNKLVASDEAISSVE
jgi:hypothetical protein